MEATGKHSQRAAASAALESDYRKQSEAAELTGWLETDFQACMTLPHVPPS